jgi:hypothetical protein
MNCSDLFYNNQSTFGTLHSRTKLSKSILSKGIAKKDALIDYLRAELEDSFGCSVKFWLQGSYKSFTLIAPVNSQSTYDIDVGIYLISDVDTPDVDAKDVKEVLKATLSYYCQIDTEAKIQDSKNACEGLKFENFLTIDTPIYFIRDIKNSTPLLATDNGWVDSDPIAIQTWLTNSYSTDTDRSLMKRNVRYLKAWANIRWKQSEHKKIPSLALNILVANNLHIGDNEISSFEKTVSNICSQLSQSFEVLNPLNGQDILGMSDEARAFAVKQFDHLNSVYLKVKHEDEATKALEYSNLFEHYFPQLPVLTIQQDGVSVPVVTNIPEIYVERYDSSGNYLSGEITNQIDVRKGDSLTFKISNPHDFIMSDEVHWTVRNEGNQSISANDIGHSEITSINDTSQRGSAYTGTHAMECLVKSWGSITGFNLVKVRVRPVAQIVKSKVFKGFNKFGKRR